MYGQRHIKFFPTKPKKAHDPVGSTSWQAPGCISPNYSHQQMLLRLKPKLTFNLILFLVGSQQNAFISIEYACG
jgi:hypothetical protein